MEQKTSRFALVAVLLVLLVAGLVVAFCCMRGCRPSEDDRADDPAYNQSLNDVVEARKPLVKARNETVSEMKALIAKARAALPAGAADEDVKAELEGHPEKYPGWKDLNERIVKDNAAIEGSLKDAQERVRARILKQLGSAPGTPSASTQKGGKE